MAISFDAASGPATANPGTSVTQSHTVASGSNLALVVVAQSGGDRTTTDSCTWNGTSMTKVDSVYDVNLGRTVSIFLLLNPDTGTHNAVYSPGVNILCKLAVASYQGVAQTGQPDAKNETTESTESPSISVTTVADNCWAVGVLGSDTAITVTTGNNRTTTAFPLVDNGPKTPAGSVSIAGTCSSAHHAHQILSLAPAPEEKNINVSDSVSVGESVSVTVFPPDLAIDVSDSVSVAEDVSIIIDPLAPSVSDSVSVGESVEGNITPLYISVDDSVAVGESVTVAVTPLYISVDDSVAVAESVSVFTAPLNPNVDDSVSVAESVSVVIEQLTPSVDDTVTVGESVSPVVTPLNISVSDTVTISETGDESLEVAPALAETVTVGESVTMMMDLNVVASDAVTVAESVDPDMWMARAGLVHMRSTEQEYPLMMDEDETD